MPANLHLSVVLPTRNPDAERLRRALAGLTAQTLHHSCWELLIVDNASDRAWEIPVGVGGALPGLNRLSESRVGLTPARLAGIRAARGEVLVFVDDDNVLAPHYLAAVAQRFAESASLGAAGGPVMPEWETPPPEWTREFHSLLALREHTAESKIARGGAGTAWPAFAPVGAGLAVHRRHALAYADAVHRDPHRLLLDRQGTSLASGGDNDLVFTALHAGGDVAYFPELQLTHLIPAFRLKPDYLAQLNRGIMRTWVRVLALHGQCPWQPIAPFTVPLRVARAWLRRGAWRGPAERVRWAGARGQFEGLADLHRASFAR